MARWRRQLITAKVDSPDRIEPTLRNDPIDSSDPAEPMLPTDSTEPTDPIDSSEFVDPMLSAEERERQLSQEVVEGSAEPVEAMRSACHRTRALASRS